MRAISTAPRERSLASLCVFVGELIEANSLQILTDSQSSHALRKIIVWVRSLDREVSGGIVALVLRLLTIRTLRYLGIAVGDLTLVNVSEVAACVRSRARFGFPPLHTFALYHFQGDNDAAAVPMAEDIAAVVARESPSTTFDIADFHLDVLGRAWASL